MGDPHDPFEDAAARIVGARHVITDPQACAPFFTDWRGRYRGTARCVVRPGTTQETADIVRLCGKRNLAVVPQGGNTGLTGGAVPLDAERCVVVNLSRLNRIRAVDPASDAMVVEAGCILDEVRAAARDAGRHFPMLLGSSGSCEVGGLVSTNAGGTSALRYGNMRELVLGLEVVLPDGRVWDGLRALRKDNSGYALKQIFIGAEGTLGIVTAAVLKLHPQLAQAATAMVAMETVGDAVALLTLARRTLGERIEAFEILSRNQIEIVLRHGKRASPMELDQPWYVMIEVCDSTVGWQPEAELEGFLAVALEAGIVRDGVLATDETKARKIWEIRHSISEANKHEGFTVSNDTSVPIAQIPAFIEQVGARLGTEIEEAQVCYCGHIGDGNIHVIVLFSRAAYPDREAQERVAARANAIVHEESVALGGSISAEHGIGLMHRERLERFKAPLELELMRRIKEAIDPRGLMNPGKILPAHEGSGSVFRRDPGSMAKGPS